MIARPSGAAVGTDEFLFLIDFDREKSQCAYENRRLTL